MNNPNNSSLEMMIKQLESLYDKKYEEILKIRTKIRKLKILDIQTKLEKEELSFHILTFKTEDRIENAYSITNILSLENYNLSNQESKPDQDLQFYKFLDKIKKKHSVKYLIAVIEKSIGIEVKLIDLDLQMEDFNNLTR